MKEAKTKFVGGISPFTGTKVKTRKQTDGVNISKLKICSDPMNIDRAPAGSKYDEFFNAMKIGQALECEPTACSAIAHAMKKWGQRNGKKVFSRTTRNYQGTGTGRVWMLKG